MQTLLRTALAFLLLSTLSQALHAEQLPLWEAGGGIGVFDFPDYRGSDERHTYFLPIPYFVYRGDVLKVDRQSVRGELFHSKDVNLSLSLNGSVPVNSDDNRARRGMPDLDPTLEFGPSLHVALMHSENDKYRLGLHLPARAVIATDFSHVKRVGWITQPKLNLDVTDPFGYQGWKLGLQAGPLFADQRYHDYFYGVDPAFATADRPAYHAGGGYAGSQLLAAVSKRYPGFWIGAFAKWDNLQGAVFDDSPLVRSRNALSGGFAITWIFARSDKRVETTDQAE